jgi:hypothetical protein
MKIDKIIKLKKKIKGLNDEVKKFGKKRKQKKSNQTEKVFNPKQLFDTIVYTLSNFTKNEVFSFIELVHNCKLLTRF